MQFLNVKKPKASFGNYFDWDTCTYLKKTQLKSMHVSHIIIWILRRSESTKNSYWAFILICMSQWRCCENGINCECSHAQAFHSHSGQPDTYGKSTIRTAGILPLLSPWLLKVQSVSDPGNSIIAITIIHESLFRVVWVDGYHSSPVFVNSMVESCVVGRTTSFCLSWISHNLASLEDPWFYY